MRVRREAVELGDGVEDGGVGDDLGGQGVAQVAEDGGVGGGAGEGLDGNSIGLKNLLNKSKMALIGFLGRMHLHPVSFITDALKQMMWTYRGPIRGKTPNINLR